MSKKNEFRFNLRFDETDEDHRKVCQFLNDCCGSRKKARYIVKAVLSYWKLENKSVEVMKKSNPFWNCQRSRCFHWQKKMRKIQNSILWI